jgi:NADH dehydrogenase
MSERPVLVLGGTGHTGERLCLRLRRNGRAVRVVTRKPESDIATRLKNAGCEIVRGDAAQRWTLFDAAEGCGAAVCCAHIRHGEALAQACRRAGIKSLVALSSTRALSSVPPPTIAPVRRGEEAVRRSRLRWTILRPSMIVGGRRDNNLEPLVEKMRRWSALPLPDGGRHHVQPVYAEDVVDAITAALKNDGSIGRTLTLAGPEPLTLRAMLETLADAYQLHVVFLPVPAAGAARLCGLAEPLIPMAAHWREGFLRAREDRIFDISEARGVLDYAPLDFASLAQVKAAGQAEPEYVYADVLAPAPGGLRNAGAHH